MALVNPVGYDATVDEQEWLGLNADAGILYNFGGSLSSMRPTAGGAGDRAVTVAEGLATAKGSRIVNDGPLVKNHDSVSSGVRYDLGVIRRNFGTDATTFEIIQGGSTAALPARNVGYPIDDQPVYLAKVTAGSTAVEVTDLRVFVNNGGAIAMHKLALGYLNRPGASVDVDGVKYEYVVRSGAGAWVTSRSSLSPIDLFDAGGPLAGGTPPASGFLVQGGTETNTTNSSGYSRITFPTPFPNGLLTIQLANGDTSVDRAIGEILQYGVAGSPYDTGQKSSVVYAVMRPRSTSASLNTANLRHRVNWLAIGW